MTNLHCTSQSYWSFSSTKDVTSIPSKTKEFTWTKLLPIICKVSVGRGVTPSEATVMVVLVGLFAQSYLFATKTTVCTLANMLAHKL